MTPGGAPGNWVNPGIGEVRLGARWALGTGQWEEGMMGHASGRRGHQCAWGNRQLVREVVPGFPIRANGSTAPHPHPETINLGRGPCPSLRPQIWTPTPSRTLESVHSSQISKYIYTIADGREHLRGKSREDR